MTVIEKIEIIMKEKGITRYQIEKKLGIKQTTFKNWVNGTEPGIEKIITILKYLEVSADEIFEIKHSDDLLKLTDDERQLLDAYRSADARGKENILWAAKREENQGKSLDCKIG